MSRYFLLKRNITHTFSIAAESVKTNIQKTFLGKYELWMI